MSPWGLLLVAIGILAMLGGVFDWDWFMAQYKERLLIRRVGRTGARVFYVCMGAGVVAWGFVVAHHIS
ncbi:hypothetical protein HN371_02635 [Candidatus Poribacteria bacterium]|jgi:hypothetical protein|nr:hypothetical protein [Candidatus Poribacteria bacterium]MBT5535473.1 hypothetical protein [Candidatus Poribacteria bacterium]MBT5710191.1 hypothetical protein [Candidatus Poribacteria bacterium]MBT7096258.1 hypothetical protein [Candidatus Poribacteria bacterium]MBT7804445.1 hypothetical protein [Candidatus Poribacteria bacterium]